jgi:hypothetical protein
VENGETEATEGRNHICFEDPTPGNRIDPVILVFFFRKEGRSIPDLGKPPLTQFFHDNP